jgi:hypothetical protein
VTRNKWRRFQVGRPNEQKDPGKSKRESALEENDILKIAEALQLAGDGGQVHIIVKKGRIQKIRVVEIPGNIPAEDGARSEGICEPGES